MFSGVLVSSQAHWIKRKKKNIFSPNGEAMDTFLKLLGPQVLCKTVHNSTCLIKDLMRKYTQIT